MAPLAKDLHKSWFGEFYGRTTGHLIRRRWWWLLAVALATVFFGLQMQQVEFDNSSDIWFVEGHQRLVAKKRFDAAFGNDESVFLLFTKEETPFTPENLRAMAALIDQLENEVPYARDVTWLGNVERIQCQAVPGLYTLCAVQIALIALFLDDKHQAGAFAGQAGIMEGLADALGPLVGKVIFNIIGVCRAVAAGAVAHDNFYYSALFGAPPQCRVERGLKGPDAD